MRYSIDQILEWQKCNCGRSWCYVFDGSVGEHGTSLSENDLHDAIEDLKEDKYIKESAKKKAIKHIESLL